MKAKGKHNLLAVPRGVEVTDTGLKITVKLPYDHRAAVMKGLQRWHRCALWVLGDGFIYGQERFGEMFSQAIEEHSEETARNAMWVSAKVDPVRRITALSWSHHQLVASLEPREQSRFLQEAVDHGWRVHELRESVKAFKLLLAPEPKIDWQEPRDPPEVPIESEEYPEVEKQILPASSERPSIEADFKHLLDLCRALRAAAKRKDKDDQARLETALDFFIAEHDRA